MALNTAQVTWNANIESDLAGYSVHFGQYPGLYLFSQDVGNVTQLLLDAGDFNNDGTWFFALQAYDTSNNLSGLSAPVSKRIVRVGGQLRKSKP